MTRLLFIGDIVGKPGRELVKRGLGPLVARHAIDFVIANGENAAAGFGITPDIADDLFSYGVHVITGGNHHLLHEELTISGGELKKDGFARISQVGRLDALLEKSTPEKPDA